MEESENPDMGCVADCQEGKEKNGSSSNGSLRKRKHGFVTKMNPPLVANGTPPKEEDPTEPPSRLQCYLQALRPWSFTASFLPAVLGAVLAWRSVAHSDPVALYLRVILFVTTSLTALSVHAAGNLVNTYCDFKCGVDKNPSSDDRTLVDRLLRPVDVETMAAVCYAIGVSSFIATLLLAPPSSQLAFLSLVFFLGMSGSFLYTGWVALKYVACGEVVIFFAFGPLTVLFAFLAQGGQLSHWPMLYALPLALNSVAILHANNVRDAESDRKAGIVTMAILVGPQLSWLCFCLLVLSPYAMFALVGLHWSAWSWLPCLTVWMAFDLEKQYRRGELAKMPHKVAQLNLFTGALYILALVVSTGTDLPGLRW